MRLFTSIRNSSNAAPAKVRAGYANFAIDEPPLKLVLIENARDAGSLNHLGVEVFSTAEVTDATRYLSEVGLSTTSEEETTCCYAVQDKVWVDGVDGVPWEVYTVLSDSATADGIAGDAQCCTPAPPRPLTARPWPPAAERSIFMTTCRAPQRRANGDVRLLTAHRVHRISL